MITAVLALALVAQEPSAAERQKQIAAAILNKTPEQKAEQAARAEALKKRGEEMAAREKPRRAAQKAREARVYQDVLAIEAEAARRAVQSRAMGSVSVRDYRSLARYQQGLPISPRSR